MDTLGFGQKVGQIMQMAYVVKAIRAAMHWWVRDCKVGPWFLLESFTGPEQRPCPAVAPFIICTTRIAIPGSSN